MGAPSLNAVMMSRRPLRKDAYLLDDEENDEEEEEEEENVDDDDEEDEEERGGDNGKKGIGGEAFAKEGICKARQARQGRISCRKGWKIASIARSTGGSCKVWTAPDEAKLDRRPNVEKYVATSPCVRDMGQLLLQPLGFGLDSQKRAVKTRECHACVTTSLQQRSITNIFSTYDFQHVQSSLGAPCVAHNIYQFILGWFRNECLPKACQTNSVCTWILDHVLSRT